MDLKPIHAKWIVDWYNHVIKGKEMIVRGFSSRGISEAVQNVQDIYEKIENPFRGEQENCPQIIARGQFPHRIIDPQCR